MLAPFAMREITTAAACAGVQLLTDLVNVVNGVRAARPRRGTVLRRDLPQVAFCNTNKFRGLRRRKASNRLLRLRRKNHAMMRLKLCRQTLAVLLHEFSQLRHPHFHSRLRCHRHRPIRRRTAVFGVYSA